MAAMRGTRVPIGSASWINEERTTALSIVQAEAEEFSFAARNEFDWLNEHMAGVFNENEINVAEIFKTPGKLRSKTPRTARKVDNGEPRIPLSDVFSSTPNGAPNTFTQHLTRATPNANPAPSTSSPLINRNISPLKAAPSPRPVSKQPVALADSGYYGSQDVDNMDNEEEDDDDMDVDLIEEETQIGEPRSSPPKTAGRTGHVAFEAIEQNAPQSPTETRTMRSPEITFQTAKEEQTTRVIRDLTEESPSPASSKTSAAPSPAKEARTPSPPIVSPKPRSAKKSVSPIKASPQKRSPAKQSSPPSSPVLGAAPSPMPEPSPAAESQDDVDVHMDDDTRSPSDDESSPIRPVRKSSLNFASLPAREPLKNKSIGARVSRTSHLDMNRQSYYGRQTGGKSLGNNMELLGESDDEEGNDDGMSIDGSAEDTKEVDNYASNHNKTYTQRLQDQINLLGKSQPNASRPSKSIPSSAVAQQLAQTTATQSVADAKAATPAKKSAAPPTPGAFPEDDDEEDEVEAGEEDDWIAPPVPAKDTPLASPRPHLPKSHTADVMEGIDRADTVSGPEFALPKQRQSPGRSGSPKRAPVIPERTTSVFGHGKSASVSVLPDLSTDKMVEDLSPAKKHVSVSNPLSAVPEDGRPETPQSPTRSFRDSPLKQVKNKLSSILKSSKGLLASSAAISAEGKSSLMSPSTTRFGINPGPSTDSIVPQSVAAEPLYPDLSKRIAADAQTLSSMGSPEKPVARRTRASVEKEKEDKRKEKEAKLMADQMSKLDKARADEREKARTFSKEQEKIAAMEKKIAAQKEKEPEQDQVREVERSARTPAPKEAPKPTRTSPRKAKAQAEAEAAAQASQSEKPDVEMAEAPTPRPPPSAPRSVGPSQTARQRELRRPMKPTKEAPSKIKQAPTVIRVNTGSQHSQFHPSNSTLSSGLQETLVSSVKSKSSQPGSHSKQSLASMKSSVSSNGRPKALELAAKRKEQEEREAQRKRDAKLELERKRAAIQEEERKQELQRRQEAERQREREREQAEAKKSAQRQAAIERAKQTRAPPPAVRSQPNGPPDYTASQRSDGQPPRPPSRMNSMAHRSQEDRPVNAVLSNASKPGSKRPLPQDSREDTGSRNPPARNGQSYKTQEAKRRRTSDDFADELDMDIQPPNIKGPPVRPPSVGFKKDMPTKSTYGYTNAPPSASRDLFKSTVTAQHHSTIKSTKQVDMNQFAQGHIPFAPNPNPAGPAHKTPARPMGAASTKSTAKATRSSPRFQDGEKIELPEIDTDEDEDDDDSHFGVAPWADSPDLRRALMKQETMNPEGIFGPPRALNMEEVFNNKERWHKFRARTSSANWSGSDRLTEDEIRKDLAARDKLRREGGWSYEMSKDLITESRKRSRATPAKPDHSIPSSFKKRKLDANGNPIVASSPTTPKTTPGANSSAVKKSARSKITSSPVSAYDVPDSPEDNPPRRIRNVRSVDRPTAKVPIPPRRNVDVDIYDIPCSDDELHSSPKEVNSQKASPTKKKSNAAADHAINEVNGGETIEEPQPRKGRSNRVLGKDEKYASTEESSSQIRSSGRRRTLTAKALEYVEKVASRSATPTSHARSSAAVDEVSKSKKATGKVNRNVSMPLKGILTPSKRDGTPRRSKSVAFDSASALAQEEVFFEDLPTKSGRSRKPSQKVVEAKVAVAKPGKSRKAPPKVIDEEPQEEEEAESEVEEQQDEKPVAEASEQEEEEDEDVCSICTKPDSKPGNRILFCDGCDKAFHQKCYNVPKVPRGDWFCNECVGQKQSRAVAADEAVKTPNFAQHLSNLQRVLLDRCTGRRRIKLIDQDDAYEKAHQLVEQTVLAGEGNSMLVIGARGCGKTTLLESIVDDLSLQHKKEFHVVRLNGFIHTDDKLALKEIWRQLGKEMEAEDEANARSNYADTMASLLALLSHPSEMARAEEGVTSQAVVFIIDEFDMFAAHPRQTLLYNLFDIAQARKAPIAVLGCTTRMDVVESLEKRVKSRFSHRYVYLSLPKSLPAYWKICKQGLCVDDEDMDVEGIDVNVDGHEAFHANWKAMIEVLYKEKAFQSLLQYHYATTKSVSAFLSACILPLSALSSTSLDLVIPPTPSGALVSLTPPNSKLHLLSSLSELDLGLLIAAARLDIVAHTDTVNFAMAYDEYGSLMGRQRVQSASSGLLALGGGVRVWGRGVAGLSWERLVALGLLVPAGLGTGRASGYGGLEGKMWKVDMALEEIPAGLKLNNVLARWCKEI
ncbi:inner centromere protein [Colletotrichum scovillei]|uniref:Origin recognition complex subunit 4 n=1 Tax=Colletotrichum scovillei TaxID=1209932 RepID=A0A9P7R2Y1_9PEZI|nr:inner centromere protein [Colletotrichum scovillei]